MMYTIHKITLNPTVDFAADELKKYLRMMMPRCGEVTIDYDADAKEDFRIGLMQDFGLDVSDAEDPTLDDIVYVEADAEGGIIAGGGETRYVAWMDNLFMWLFTIPSAFLSAFVFEWSPVVTFCFLKADQVIKCLPNAIVCSRYRWVRILTRNTPS